MNSPEAYSKRRDVLDRSRASFVGLLKPEWMLAGALGSVIISNINQQTLTLIPEIEDVVIEDITGVEEKFFFGASFG